MSPWQFITPDLAGAGFVHRVTGAQLETSFKGLDLRLARLKKSWTLQDTGFMVYDSNL